MPLVHLESLPRRISRSDSLALLPNAGGLCRVFPDTSPTAGTLAIID